MSLLAAQQEEAVHQGVRRQCVSEAMHVALISVPFPLLQFYNIRSILGRRVTLVDIHLAVDVNVLRLGVTIRLCSRIVLLCISLLLICLVYVSFALSKVFLDLLISRSRSLQPRVTQNFGDTETRFNLELQHAGQ